MNKSDLKRILQSKLNHKGFNFTATEVGLIVDVFFSAIVQCLLADGVLTIANLFSIKVQLSKSGTHYHPSTDTNVVNVPKKILKIATSKYLIKKLNSLH